MQFKGVILNPRLPVGTSLGVELDLTGLFSESGSDYISFKQGLEDKLNKLDEAYAKHVNKLRGRRLVAQYKTYFIGKEKVRGRFLFVVPYPSVFSSILSEIRTEFYDKTRGMLVKHNCIPLSSIVEGRHKFVTYFLHEQDAVELSRDVDLKLNSKIQELNRRIAEFERSRDFENVIGYIREKVSENRWSRYPVQSYVHPIELHYQPLIIGKEIVEMYTDAKLREQLNERMKDLAMRIVQDFHNKLTDWIEVFSQNLEAKRLDTEMIGRLEHKFKQIESVANRYGIRQALSREFGVIQSLIDSVKTGNIETGVMMVANYVGVESKSDIRSTMAEIRMNLKNVSQETRALIENLF